MVSLAPHLPPSLLPQLSPFTEPVSAFLPSLSQPLLLSLPSLLQVDLTTQVPEGGLWLVLTRLVVPLGLLNQTLRSQLQEQVAILPRPRDQVSDGHTTLFLEQEKEAWNTDHVLIAFLWLKSNAAGGNWSSLITNLRKSQKSIAGEKGKRDRWTV